MCLQAMTDKVIGYRFLAAEQGALTKLGTVWKFPIRGPFIDPNISCSLLPGLPNRAPDFFEPPHVSL